MPGSAGYIDDDTAYIPEKDLILTQDTLIEDVHFRLKTTTPHYLGRKSVAVNLSDIAAAGGVPEYVMVSLSMPEYTGESFVREFYKGVNSICEEYNTVVVGGDLTAAEKTCISICATGSGNGLIPASRKNASAGDIVALTGNFGSSRAGLHILEEPSGKIPEKVKAKFIRAHINPVARIKEGRKILRAARTPAMMDASDGLGDALVRVCLLSNVEMEIEFGEIPYDKDIYKVTEDEHTVNDWILFGGEDYELVATMPGEVYEELRKEIFIRKIGTVKPARNGPFANIRFKDGSIFRLDSSSLDEKPGLFRHFQ